MNMIAAINRSAFIAVLLTTFCTLAPAADEGARLVRPDGWTESATTFNREGLKVLFMGRRADRTGQMSTLVVSHIAQLTSAKDVKDYLGGYLDSFAKRDPYLFLQANLEKLSVAGRCVVYVKVLGRNLHPRKEDFHTYIFMTEAGIYSVQFTTEGEDHLDVKGFLKESLTITAKEAAFDEDVARVYADALPELKAEELKQLNQFNRQISQANVTNQPPDFLAAALGIATFGVIETKAYRGTNTFEAKLNVDSRSASGAKQIPLTIQNSGPKTRTEARLTDFGTFPDSAKSEFRRMSLERVVTILDPTTKRLQILLPDAEAYLDIQAPSLLIEMIDRRLSLVPLGTEVWLGHSCEKTQFTESGRTNPPTQAVMVAWNRLDLDRFPVRIEITRPGNAMVLTADFVQFRNGAAAVFEVPPGFTRYATSGEIVKAMTRKDRERSAGTK
jgi:hypothetical protein